MFKYINLSRYNNCNSSIHKLNPIIKILCFIIFIVSVLFAKDIYFGLIVSILLINMILMCNLNLSIFLSFLNKIKYILIILFFMLLFCGISITNNLLILLKTFLLIFYLFLFVCTTSFDDLLYAFSKILIPLKIFNVDINKTSAYIANIFMFIPSYFEEYYRIYTSICLRVDVLKFKVCIMAIIPAFKSNLKKFSERLDLLLLRHYNSECRHSNYKNYRIRLVDIFILAVHIVFIVAIVLKGVIL